MFKLNEAHVIASCPMIRYDRDVLGISGYFRVHSADLSRKFKVFLGGDNAPTTTVHRFTPCYVNGFGELGNRPIGNYFVL